MRGDSTFDFIYDVETLIASMFGVIEFIIGISYVAGKHLTSGILDACRFIWGLGKNVLDGVGVIAEVVTDVFREVMHGVLLIYFGIGKIFDAFQTTFDDSVFFVKDTLHTISQLVETCFHLVFQFMASLTLIPAQLCSALSIIGDFVMNIYESIEKGCLHVVSTLIMTPANALQSLQNVGTYLSPTKVLAAIPVSAHIGLLTIFLCYFIYCRLSFRVFFRTIFSLLRRLLGSCWTFGEGLMKYFVTPVKIGVVTSSDESQGGKIFSGMCVVCFDKPVAYLASPCSHICVCKDCCYQLVNQDSRCPLCRKAVDSYSRVYIS